MVRYWWWGMQFCRAACKQSYLGKLAYERERLKRWLGSDRLGVNRWPTASTRISVPELFL
jgi:hypothetical protein